MRVDEKVLDEKMPRRELVEGRKAGENIYSMPEKSVVRESGQQGACPVKGNKDRFKILVPAGKCSFRLTDTMRTKPR